MEKCPKCEKYYLMYEPQMRKAVCTDCEFEFEKELSHIEYVTKYANPIKPKTHELKLRQIKGLRTSPA